VTSLGRCDWLNEQQRQQIDAVVLDGLLTVGVIDNELGEAGTTRCPERQLAAVFYLKIRSRQTSRVVLSRRQTIDKVGQLLWAWFSFERNSADEIVEP